MTAKQSQLKQSCKSASKFILSRLALILAVSLYAVAGGFIFEHLESTNEKQDCVERMNQYLPAENDTVNKMWTILSSYRSPGDAPYAVAAYHKQLSMFRDTILSINYDGSNCTAMGEPDGPAYQWSLSGAILFSTTVFTTVGLYTCTIDLRMFQATILGTILLVGPSHCDRPGPCGQRHTSERFNYKFRDYRLSDTDFCVNFIVG